MRIVIVGDGKVGYALSEQLTSEDHDIVVIDSRREVLEASLNTLDVKVVRGNGATFEVQREAEVEDSDVLVAATSADEVNLLCCIVARKLGCPHTIARVRNPEYAQLRELQAELGLSLMTNPESACALEIFRQIQFPSFLHLDSFAKGRAEIVEFELRTGSPLIGHELMDFDSITHVNSLVCAVDRGGEVFIPDGFFRLEEKDKISVAASAADLARLVRSLELSRKKIRNILIVGGGSNIAYYLTRSLSDQGARITLIERQRERCEKLAEYFPKANIVLGDGSDRRVLDAEGIAMQDAVVTLTDVDEENLIISMYADFVGVPKVVTKINRAEYTEMFRDRNLGRVVSPKEACTTEIVRYVRAMQNTSGGEVLALHRLVDGRLEALEFRATRATQHLRVPLRELKLKPDILIACINRMGRVVIPRGSDSLRLGDTVIVVTFSDRMIKDLNDIFADPEPV
ncbi:MAG: Trk system potassium transporter TrkA [Clostridia bacterium]|nr:Trk system potassium transporter TrkA [Clostridia bacterium]